MSNAIKIILILALTVIIVVVVSDHLSDRPDKRPDNPYAYTLDDYKHTDSSLIQYRETKQIELRPGQARAMAYRHGLIYLLHEQSIQAITTEGIEVMSGRTDMDPLCLEVSQEGNLIIGYANYLVVYDTEGVETKRSDRMSDRSRFTALAVSEDYIFVADAGSRQILVFNHELEQTDAFAGESGVSAAHGFIIPSAHFDLAVNEEQELWVVNPGLHQLQNYTASGRLRGYWGKSSIASEGFSGCCNPYYIGFLSDGSFITSEKGLLRVKVYEASGELRAFVAPPERFQGSIRAPAIAATDQDEILLLDFDRNIIRFFVPL